MHLAKQKNLVCWTVDSDKVFLELVDVTKIDDFQTTVNRLKTLTDQLIVVVPKEANNDHSGQSAMAVEVSHTLNVCTAQLKSDATQVTQHPTLENESVIADNSSCTNIDEKISNKSKNTIDEECPEASPQEESPRYTGNVQCSDHPSDCLEVSVYICIFMYFISFSDFTCTKSLYISATKWCKECKAGKVQRVKCTRHNFCEVSFFYLAVISASTISVNLSQCPG